MSGCELSDLSVTSRERASASSFATNLYPAVVIESAGSVVLRRSSLRMDSSPSKHAVLTIHGGPMRIEDNEIVADGGGTANAWGGIQVVGQSRLIRIVRNRISNGYGHGITLGSVIWFNTTDFSTRSNLGAGKTLVNRASTVLSWAAGGDFSSFSDDGITQFEALDEGLLQDVAILNNRIEGMSANGISALSVLGLPGIFFNGSDRELPQVQRIRIDGNVIVGNVLRYQVVGVSFRENLVTEADPRSPVGAAIQSLPLGGIVLATVSDVADVRNNLIADNGNNSSVAAMT